MHNSNIFCCIGRAGWCRFPARLKILGCIPRGLRRLPAASPHFFPLDLEIKTRVVSVQRRTPSPFPRQDWEDLPLAHLSRDLSLFQGQTFPGPSWIDRGSKTTPSPRPARPLLSRISRLPTPLFLWTSFLLCFLLQAIPILHPYPVPGSAIRSRPTCGGCAYARPLVRFHPLFDLQRLLSNPNCLLSGFAFTSTLQ